MHSSEREPRRGSVSWRARELLAGQRAMVIGLAREGLDLTRFLTAHGASVVVTDQKPADAARRRAIGASSAATRT